SLFICAAPNTEIYTLSLHDALPISSTDDNTHRARAFRPGRAADQRKPARRGGSEARSSRWMDQRRERGQVPHRSPHARPRSSGRSEEHTSELQSRENLVCRLLLENK